MSWRRLLVASVLLPPLASPVSADSAVNGAGVKARQSATLIAPIAEQIKSIADIDDSVKEGDVVAILHCGIPIARLQSAKAALKTAKLDLALAESEVKVGVGSTSVRDHKQALASEKQADLNVSRTIAGKCTIRAPFDGEIVDVFAGVGSSISAGEPLIELLTSNDIFIQMWASAEHWGRFQVGETVTLRSQHINHDIQGVVAKRGGSINQQRKFYVEISIQESEGSGLVPGMVVSVE